MADVTVAISQCLFFAIADDSAAFPFLHGLKAINMDAQPWTGAMAAAEHGGQIVISQQRSLGRDHGKLRGEASQQWRQFFCWRCAGEPLFDFHVCVDDFLKVKRCAHEWLS
ncbi:hypothetical protein ACZ75_10480 [Massilia sp. NR 4-1]|nr:hypothetical protein ACZ75_10480 [Massilia sp. NR 4-1]